MGIRMKKITGRPHGKIDVEYLRKSLPMPRTDEEAIDWSLTAWEGAERERLRRWAELSLEEIVLAQEEMQSLAKGLKEKVGDPS